MNNEDVKSLLIEIIEKIAFILVIFLLMSR